MRLVSVLLASALLAGGGAAAAQQQHNEADFHDEVLRRLDRIERMLERIERDSDRPAQRPSGRPAARDEVVAAVSEMCGGSCGMAAQNYCRRTGFANGVPLQIERRGVGNFEHVVRVRCFN